MYLAEVSNNPTIKINEDNEIMDTLNQKQKKYGFSDTVKKDIFDSKKNNFKNRKKVLSAKKLEKKK